MTLTAQDLIDKADVLGFSGYRKATQSAQFAARWACMALRPDAEVWIGDAPGIDWAVRKSLQAMERPYHMLSVGQFGVGRGAYARRSIAVVDQVATSGHPDARRLWVSFPGQSCHPSLTPAADSRACFAGYGSGTWASLAYAMGLGLPALVRFDPVEAELAPGTPPPPWGFQRISESWWYWPGQASMEVRGGYDANF